MATVRRRGEKRMERPRVKRPSKELLERLQNMEDKRGMIAVIEPDTGDYYLAKTLTDGLKAMMTRHPGKIFYSIRIGYSYVYGHRGGLHKV